MGCAAYSRKVPASVTSPERNHIACLQSINRFVLPGRHLADQITAVAFRLQGFLLHIVATPVLRFPVVIAPILPTTLQVGFLHFIQQVHLASNFCLLYTSPSPRDRTRSRMPSSA